MTPTPKLRFVKRDDSRGEYFMFPPTKDVLQQWWAVERDGQITPTGEWRDVPVEKENV